MTLSRSSVLHYWSSRYGPLPVIGGKPVHTRNSAGAVADERGELYDAIINTPRFSWETDKATTANERRAALLLELARTNSVPFSTDFANAVWTKLNATITAGVLDPRGGTSACTLTATAANGAVFQSLAAGTAMIRANAFWIRRRTGTGAVGILRADSGGYVTVPVTSVWTRFSPGFSTSATARDIGVSLATSGDAVDLYNGQQEDATFNTADIVNTGASATSRGADAFSWSYAAPPQGAVIFSRHVEGGTIQASSARLWTIASSGDASPRLLIFVSGGVYVLYNENGGNVQSSLGAAPAFGDTVDLAAIITATGAVQLVQSINGAAVTSGTLSSALTVPTAYSGALAWLNSVSASSVGASRFLEWRALKYADVVAATAQGIMDEVRAFELGPNGEAL